MNTTQDIVHAVADSLSDANQPGNIEAQISHLIACVRDDVLAHDGKLAARAQLAENRLKVLIGLAVKQARALPTREAAIAAIDDFEIVGENNASRDPTDEERFVLGEFVARLFEDAE